MTADPRALTELLEESQDLQADAMRPTHEALNELVELNHESLDDDPSDEPRVPRRAQSSASSFFRRRDTDRCSRRTGPRRCVGLGGQRLELKGRADPSDCRLH